jgi:hypothetical protein
LTDSPDLTFGRAGADPPATGWTSLHEKVHRIRAAYQRVQQRNTAKGEDWGDQLAGVVAAADDAGVSLAEEMIRSWGSWIAFRFAASMLTRAASAHFSEESTTEPENSPSFELDDELLLMALRRYFAPLVATTRDAKRVRPSNDDFVRRIKIQSATLEKTAEGLARALASDLGELHDYQVPDVIERVRLALMERPRS